MGGPATARMKAVAPSLSWRILEASMRRYNWAAREQGLKFRIEIFEISDFLEGAEIFSNPKFRLLFYYYDKKIKNNKIY